MEKVPGERKIDDISIRRSDGNDCWTHVGYSNIAPLVGSVNGFEAKFYVCRALPL
jgi:hypothetical protein